MKRIIISGGLASLPLFLFACVSADSGANGSVNRGGGSVRPGVDAGTDGSVNADAGSDSGATDDTDV